VENEVDIFIKFKESLSLDQIMGNSECEICVHNVARIKCLNTFLVNYSLSVYNR